MAFTTLAGVLAAMQPPLLGGRRMSLNLNNCPSLVSFWSDATDERPAGAYDTTLNGVVLSSSSGPVNGQLPFLNAPAGDAYLARHWISSTITDLPTVWLVDRLWHNGGINVTSTSAQGITSPTWPARDENGSTNGEGVLLALEASVSTANVAFPTVTVSYTNSAGVAGRTATLVRVTQTAVVPAFSVYFFSLQSGDTGVRSVQSITLGSSWTSGTVNLFAYRLIQPLHLGHGGGPPLVTDPVTGCLPKMWPGSVPFYLMQGTPRMVWELRYAYG